MVAEAEIKRLNKTVEEAVSLLRSTVGNTATARVTQEKEREAIEKFHDAVDKQEDIQKDEEDLIEDKKRDRQLAMKVFSTAQGIFNGAMNHISKVFSEIKSQFMGLFGEESEWFGLLGSIKDSIQGFFAWFIKGFTLFIRRTPAHARKTNQLLGSMLGMMRREEKMEALTGGKKRGRAGILGVLGLVLAGAVALLGAFIRKAILPFQLLVKGLRVGPIMKGITSFFTKTFPLIGKFFTRISTWFLITFNKLKPFFAKIPLFGRIASAFGRGFTKLFLPLTIILSAIDFIKGFIGDEGTFLDKMMSGIKELVHGFLDIPINMISWLIEKISGLFGFEVEGTAEKVKGWIDLFINNIVPGFTSMFDTLGSFFNQATDILGPVVNKFIQAFEFFINLIKDLWNSMVDFFSGPKVKKVLDFFGVSLPEKIEEPTPETSPVDAMRDLEKKKVKGQQEQNKNLKNSIDEQTAAVKESADRSEAAVQTVTAMVNQQDKGMPGGEVKQIPDELDNFIMDIKNYSGDFD